MSYQQLRFILQRDEVAALESVFEDVTLGVASFEVNEAQATWQTTMTVEQALDDAEITRRLAVITEVYGVEVAPPFREELDETRDWVSEVQQSFPPLAIGRFMVLGSHHDEVPPAGTTVIWQDAGAAFGTGEHATTQGCLLAMEQAVARKRPSYALDMGCGSGILAIGLAKRWHVPVRAVDIDPVSVAVTRQNALRNGVGRLVETQVGNGYVGLQRCFPRRYDLIISNILAGPLVAFAPKLAASLAPGGTAILSGLLGWQENQVLHAHRQQGLSLVRRIRIGEWSTLVLAAA